MADKRQDQGKMFGRLRELLSQPPSERSWRALLGLLGQWRDEGLEVAQEYVVSHVADWPAQLKIFPSPTPEHPLWLAAAGVQLHYKDASSLSGLHRHPHIRRLHWRGELAAVHWQKLAEFPQLEHLSIDQLEGLDDLSALSAFPQLKSFCVGAAARAGFWEAMTPCGRLHQLEGIEACEQLEQLELYCEIAQLEGALSPLYGLGKLRALHLCNMLEVSHLDGIEALGQLEELRLGGLRGEAPLGPLEALTRLRLLSLHLSSELVDLGSLPTLPELRGLQLQSCISFRSLRGLEKCQQLEKIELEGCLRLEDIDAIAGLPQLAQLSLPEQAQLPASWPRQLEGREQLDEWLDCQGYWLTGASTQHQAPAELALCGDDFRPSFIEPMARGLLSLHYPSKLPQFPQAQALHLRSIGALRDLEWLVEMTGLRRLTLQRCLQLRDLQGLSGLGQLWELDLSDCLGLEDLSPLAALEELQRLDLSIHLDETQEWQLSTYSPAFQVHYCEGLDFLGAMARLQWLGLRNQRYLEDISALSQLSRLEHLDLQRCGSLVDIEALGSCGSLRHLSLAQCHQLIDLSALAGLEQLEHLDLSGLCLYGEAEQKGQGLGFLEALDGLEFLSLAAVETRSSLAALGQLSGLQRLDLTGFRQLNDDLEGLDFGAFEQLESLKLGAHLPADTARCWSLVERLPEAISFVVDLTEFYDLPPDWQSLYYPDEWEYSRGELLALR